jgi:integrase
MTGWRLPSEILPLAWERVDLEAGTVRLEPATTKSKEGRVIYLPEEPIAVLRNHWREHVERFPDCPYVFHQEGKRMFSFYKVWHRACREAGLAGKIPHDFRRTAVRNMVRAGIPERVAMQVSGHKTRSVFDRYHIVADADLREATERLKRLFRGQTITVSITDEESTAISPPATH